MFFPDQLSKGIDRTSVLCFTPSQRQLSRWVTTEHTRNMNRNLTSNFETSFFTLSSISIAIFSVSLRSLLDLWKQHLKFTDQRFKLRGRNQLCHEFGKQASSLSIQLKLHCAFTIQRQQRCWLGWWTDSDFSALEHKALGVCFCTLEHSRHWTPMALFSGSNWRIWTHSKYGNHSSGETVHVWFVVFLFSSITRSVSEQTKQQDKSAYQRRGCAAIHVPIHLGWGASTTTTTTRRWPQSLRFQLRCLQRTGNQTRKYGYMEPDVDFHAQLCCFWFWNSKKNNMLFLVLHNAMRWQNISILPVKHWKKMKPKFSFIQTKTSYYRSKCCGIKLKTRCSYILISFCLRIVFSCFNLATNELIKMHE